MNKKIMLLSLGSLAAVTAIVVPIAVVFSGGLSAFEQAQEKATSYIENSKDISTKEKVGYIEAIEKTKNQKELDILIGMISLKLGIDPTAITGITGAPLQSTVAKAVSKHFDTAAAFNAHTLVTDVERANDGTETIIVDQKGDFGRNKFIYAGGTKELKYLLQTSTLEKLSETPDSLLDQMESIITTAIKDAKIFPEAEAAIADNESASVSTKDVAVVSVNLARSKIATTADSIVININHASLSDAKKILEVSKAYLDKNSSDMANDQMTQLDAEFHAGHIDQAEYDKAQGETMQNMTTLKGLFERVVKSIS